MCVGLCFILTHEIRSLSFLSLKTPHLFYTNCKICTSSFSSCTCRFCGVKFTPQIVISFNIQFSEQGFADWPHARSLQTYPSVAYRRYKIIGYPHIYKQIICGVKFTPQIICLFQGAFLHLELFLLPPVVGWEKSVFSA